MIVTSLWFYIQVLAFLLSCYRARSDHPSILRNMRSVDEPVCRDSGLGPPQMCGRLIRKEHCRNSHMIRWARTYCRKFCLFCVKCETKVDIAFLVDSSGSIGRRNWYIVQRVLIDTIKEITVSADGNHVAMIHFSTRPEIVFGFHTLYGSETVELYSRKINRRRFQKGLTYIDRALELADRVIFKSSAGMRTSDEVRKIAVIITDGVQTSGSYDVISASQPLKDRGVEIYACGIGSDVDLFELYQTASNPSNVFSTNTFYSMESDFPRMIREILCQSDCDFEANSYCRWSSGSEGDIPFELTNGLLEVKGYSVGSGYYAFVNSSKKVIYDEKAILTSPKLELPPKSMMFRYLMHGKDVETLAVVKIIQYSGQSEKETLWVRHGDQGDHWRTACLSLDWDTNYWDRSYKVSFEAVAGATNASSIALDNITISDNTKLCVNHEKVFNLQPAAEDSTSANCSFNETTCGWRTVVNKMVQDGLLWMYGGERRPTSARIEDGAGHELSYIYTSFGNHSLSEGRNKAYLISPRLLEPYCMTLMYSIKSTHSILEVVLFRMRNPFLVYNLWATNGTGNTTSTVQINIPYTQSYQVLIIGKPSAHNIEDILLFDVSLQRGLCSGAYVANRPHQGNCGFQENFCLWNNVEGSLTIQEDHEMRSKVISRRRSGTGRLESPWLTGQQCMKLFFKTYTSTSITVYANNMVLWIKSGSKGSTWQYEEIFFRSTSPFQFIIEMQGTYSKGIINNITFSPTFCSHREIITYFLTKRAGGQKHQYRIERRFPLALDGYSKILEFQLETTPNDFLSGLHCVYHKPYNNKIISHKVIQNETPLDCFFHNKSSYGKQFYASFGRENVDYMVTNYFQDKCCQAQVQSIPVKSVKPPSITESSSCGRAWHQVGQSCFLLFSISFGSGIEEKDFSQKYNKKCVQFGGKSATTVTRMEAQELSFLSQKLGNNDLKLLIASELNWNTKWQWQDGSLPYSNFWGKDNQYSDRKHTCGVISSTSLEWVAVECSKSFLFICEQSVDFPIPVAMYPLNASSGANEISLDPLLRGEAYNMVQPDWLNGSYYFPGLEDSYIAINHNGSLDLMYSITITAWIFPQGNSGFIVTYGNGTGITMFDQKTLVGQLVFKEEKEYKRQQLKLSGLKNAAWNFIGISYDFSTGHAMLFIGDNIMSRKVGNRKLLATDRSVEIGSSFKGGISRVQFYDVPLNESIVPKIMKRSLHLEKPTCNDGFVSFRGRCVFFADTKVDQNTASQNCTKQKARLAMIDRAYLRHVISSYLRKESYYFIGLTNEWFGNAGKSNGNISYSLRLAKYKDIASGDVRSSLLGICRKSKINRAFNRTVSSSDLKIGSSSRFAVDGMLETCFISETKHPYLQIELDHALFIYEAVIVSKDDCCESQHQFLVTATDESSKNHNCVLQEKRGVVHSYSCIPWKRATHLYVTSPDSSLVLCEVEVFSTGEKERNGVRRDVWLLPRGKLSFENFATTNSIPVPSDMSDALIDFSAPQNILDKCGQRLSTYLKVPESGLYTFYLNCDYGCILMLNVKHSLVRPHMENTETLDIEEQQEMAQYEDKIEYRTLSKTRESVYLSRCALYNIVVLMKSKTDNDYYQATVGIRKEEEGDLLLPIPRNLLYKVLPENRTFSISFNGTRTFAVTVGTTARVLVSYRYCCDGWTCPNCTLHLFDEKNNTLIKTIQEISCKQETFSWMVKKQHKIGKHPLKISYEWPSKLKISNSVGAMHVQREVLRECTFKEGVCSWMKVKKKNNYWNKNKQDGVDFTMIDTVFSSTFETDVLPWKNLYSIIGLCLKFSYLMNSKTSNSWLAVSKLIEGNSLEVLWNITGYHGTEWKRASIPLDAIKGQRIQFSGKSDMHRNISALVNVRIQTERCAVFPDVAKPGFQCKGGYFQCNNKECLEKRKRCDGDPDCVDESDEMGCVCQSNKFQCSSKECIVAEDLCDRKGNCKDGFDEKNCDQSCNGKFQCVSGSCIDWSNTCKNESFCPDFTDSPSICGDCPLNDVRCALNESEAAREKDCRDYSLCSFQHGFCGLEQSKELELNWVINYGKTSSDGTGPDFDHTHFSETDEYIHIDASKGNKGDKARLTSDWISAEETLCLQFWYHMLGKDIGSLRILMKTNQSETVLWHNYGNQTDEWKFGQTPIKPDGHNRYKFVIEAETLGGDDGDIAVDDIKLNEGDCQKIISYNHSQPYCCVNSISSDGELSVYLINDGQNTPWKCLHLISSDVFSFFTKYSNGTEISSFNFEEKAVGFVQLQLPLPGVQGSMIEYDFEYRLTGSREYVPYFTEEECSQLTVFNNHNNKEKDINCDDLRADIAFLVSSSITIPLYTWEKVKNFLVNMIKKMTVSDQGNHVAVISYSTDATIVFRFNTLQGSNITVEAYSRLIRTMKLQQGRLRFMDKALQLATQDVFTKSAGMRGNIPKIAMLLADGIQTQSEVGHKSLIQASKLLKDQGVLVISVAIAGRIDEQELRAVVSRPTSDILRFGSFSRLSIQPVLKHLCSSSIIDFQVFSLKEWLLWESLTTSEFSSTWKITSLTEYDNYTKQHSLTMANSKQEWDFEMELSSSSRPLLDSEITIIRRFTICLWTKNYGEEIYVKILRRRPVKPSSYRYVVIMTMNISNIVVIRVKTRSNNHLQYDLDARLEKLWHFYCLDVATNKFSLFVDGEKVDSKKLENVTSLGYYGKGRLQIGYVKQDQDNITDLPIVSALNIWHAPWNLNIAKTIAGMSSGCGPIRKHFNRILLAPALWERLPLRKSKNIAIKRPASCKVSRDKVMLLKGSSDSTLVSPAVEFKKTPKHANLCFHFTYMMLGDSKKTLEVEVKTSEEAIKPVWYIKNYENGQWNSGMVPINSMSSNQISIRGKVENISGAILLGYANKTNKACEDRLKYDCSKNITSGPGVIASPYYPTYFPPNIHCTWHITAPKAHVIELEFLYFLLGYRCSDHGHFLQIFDGNSSEGEFLGKFCGYKTPTFVQSLSNSITIKFTSARKELTRGFKISYKFVKIKDYDPLCIKTSSAGCPSDCMCKSYMSSFGKRIAVRCDSLTEIPNEIPQDSIALILQGNLINTISNHSFVHMANLLYVDISSNRVFRIKEKAFINGSSMETLRLNINFLKDIPPQIFRPLENLKTLDLGRNLLKNLHNMTFSGLTELMVLGLQSNRISNLPENVFDQTSNLTYLYLQYNNICYIADGAFQHLSKLVTLNLESNNIKQLRRDTFKGLVSLKHLNLRGNKLSKISQSVFADLQSLETIKVDKFIHCCYAEKAITGVKCESLESNEFSSCDDLMKNTALRIFLWILGLSALVGNLLVICKRISGKEMRHNTNSLLLTNLAISDFLMGVYLITIASFDVKWKGEYFKHDVHWRSGVGCRITGMISMLSSVVSVAFLAIVTYDRLICVVFPFTVKRLSCRKALCICACVWIVGLVTSIIPIFDFDYFLNDEDDFGFYGRSSVCLPVQLSSDLQAGWEYSVGLFLAFPFVAFTFMLIAYIAIIKTVQKSANAVRSTAVNRESSLSKKVAFIILTDFLCWMPVIIISFLSITGIYSDPSKQMYVWIAVFVLPINSSINPFLYTFSTITSTQKSQGPPKRLPKSTENTSELHSAKSEIKKRIKISYRIHLVEKVDIQTNFDGVGAFLAEVKSLDYEDLFLIKYFSQTRTDVFKKEVDILSQLKEYKHESVIEFRWSCLANEHMTDGKSFNVIEINSASLICYEYVPNKVLENFLQDEDELSSSILCSLSVDIISAIEFLQDCGFSNNSINARSIIVREGESKVVPTRAVLVDFSRAGKLKIYDDGFYAKTDIIQFGRLLKKFLKACTDLARFKQVDEVLSLCDKERTDTTATLIKNLLMELSVERI